MQQLTDAINIGEKERRAGTLNRNNRGSQLINDDSKQQHYQTDNQNTPTSRFILFQPEREHQAAHGQQREAVEGAVVGDGHQPQECVALHQRLVEEVKDARIQGEPETMIRRDIPGEEKRQTGDIKQ